MTLYVCKVCCLKSYIINLLLTSTAWSLRENIRPRPFMYGPRPTGPRPTGPRPSGLVRTVKTSVCYFPVTTTLSVNKKLLIKVILYLTALSFKISFKGHWQQKISTFYIEVFDLSRQNTV